MAKHVTCWSCDMGQYFYILIGVLLVHNFVFSQFLGICPFLGVSRRLETAVGMGMSVIFVVVLSSVAAFLINLWILIPYHIEYLKTVIFILVIAALVQLVEMVIQKTSPVLYQALGIYLPLITTNCIVLGVAVLITQKGFDLLETTIYSFGASAGFLLALILFSGIRERLELADIPWSFRGTAIALITAGILSLSFMGFSGLVK